jgi:selenide,water dikinase
LPDFSDPKLLTGGLKKSDAAVYEIDENTLGVFTVDVFGPIVDDPETFGRIVFANCISDVCAMGGKPLLALNIALFPGGLPIEPLSDILKGCALAAKEKGVIIAGGHTTDNKEIFYGLSVFGIASKDSLRLSKNAKAGDKIILTKPIGTGILFAGKDKFDFNKAIPYMVSDSIEASNILGKFGVKCCTDVTGFGLALTCLEVAEESNVGMSLNLEDIPLIGDTLEAAQYFTCPVLAKNIDKAKDKVIFEKADPHWINIVFDAQTSGGLLAFVAPDKTSSCLDELVSVGYEAKIIGEVVTGEAIVRLA